MEIMKHVNKSVALRAIKARVQKQKNSCRPLLQKTSPVHLASEVCLGSLVREGSIVLELLKV